ncbi:hypothetical protein LGM58_38725 [Burkholderia contaminans]|uniref:hypothetical protein n=1 Tax=Burkholderia contaminans TaxID=488447 RepID=UPI001CF52516|nr:hypothetical protein [Burkholderia contaminans]MCA7889120.1 hypothetical protein [Burkholderia contaminans]
MLEIKKGSLAAKVIAIAVVIATPVASFAASAGDIANNATSSFNSIGVAIQVFFALCAIVLAGMAIFTFIKYNKTDGQGAKLSTGFIYVIGAACLFYITSLIQTGGDTVWGNGGGDKSRVQITR